MGGLNIKWIIFVLVVLASSETSISQDNYTLSTTHKFERFFIPSDTFNQQRFKLGIAFTGVAYTGFSIGLYNSWYKNFDLEPFHLYNDWGEWRHMDKMGHIYSGYFQSLLCHDGARWAGLSKNKSIWIGMAFSTLFQTTIEVMDGFSPKWGFSLPDIGANVLGTSFFAAQQHFWDEQRISIKISSIPKSYPHQAIHSVEGLSSTTLNSRVDQLYGTNFFERYLKDYNAQTYWASVRLHSFLPEGNRWPKWLNLAIGYGAENMYGGYQNSWTQNSHSFILDPKEYPRYSQVFLGFDVDLPQLNPRSPFLKTMCSVFNIFKVPSPALEINTQGQIKFHFLR